MKQCKIEIGDKEYSVRIAVTDQEQSDGLKNTYPRQIKHIIRQQALGHRLTARLGFKRQAMLSHIILIRETF